MIDDLDITDEAANIFLTLKTLDNQVVVKITGGPNEPSKLLVSAHINEKSLGWLRRNYTTKVYGEFFIVLSCKEKPKK